MGQLVILVSIIWMVTTVTPLTMDERIVASSKNVLAMDPMNGGEMNKMLVELDMQMTPRQIQVLKGYNKKSRRRRNIIKIGANYEGAGVFARWPQKVPYKFDSNFVLNSYTERVFKSAFDEFRLFTCVDFVPRTRERNYINIINGDGCYSNVGMLYGRQTVSLPNGCKTKGTIQHEMMHALGFFHEQNRPDRDKYVNVDYSNVQDYARSQFEINSEDVVDSHDSMYDYRSIMHYGPRYFSKNGLPTIVPKDDRFMSVIGRRSTMSYDDIFQINKAYECGDKCVAPPRCPKMSYLGKDCRCYCENNANPSHPTRDCTPGKEEEEETGPKTTTSSPKVPDSKNCEDIFGSCPTWANKGDCENKHLTRFMTVYCAASCALCGKDGEGQKTTVSPEIAECVDSDTKCALYSKFFFCDVPAYRKYLQENCPKSCKVCTPEQDSEETQETAKEDLLRADILAFSSIIPLSRDLGTVSTTQPVTKAPESSCQDISTICDYFINKYGCNYTYVAKRCKSSCKNCDKE